MKTFTRLLMGALAFPFFLQAQTVTTLATNTGIDDALILDAANNLYGSNYMGQSVFKRTPEGSISAFSSGFNTPNGLAFISTGELFMADNQGNKVHKIQPNGTSSVFVPSITNPSGLIKAFDSDTLIAASYAGGKLIKIAPDGTHADMPGTNVMVGPAGLAYDEDNNLYAAEFGNANSFGGRKIFKITPDGTVSLFAQLSGGGSIGFIAYAKGHLYATLIYTHTIKRIDMEGNVEDWPSSTTRQYRRNALTAKFNGPNGILASPSQDTLYVSEFNTCNLRMITDLDINTSTEIADFKAEVAIFPNPTTESFTVHTTIDDAVFLLYDMNGSMVFSKELGGGSQVVQRAAHWPNGIYFYEIKKAENVVGTGKVVLE